MKQRFLLLLLMLVPGWSFSRFVADLSTPEKKESRLLKVSLSGTVTDSKTGESLAGATIYFVNEKIGTSADAHGKYQISNIPNGHHVVEVSHLGYATYVEHIELSENTEKNFLLSPVITENQGVIVTGVSSATSVRKSPVPVATVRKQTLLQTPSTNIIDHCNIRRNCWINTGYTWHYLLSE